MFLSSSFAPLLFSVFVSTTALNSLCISISRSLSLSVPNAPRDHYFLLSVSLVLWRQCAGTYFSLSLSLSLLSHSRSLFLSPMHFSISVSKQSNFRTCNVSLSKFFCNKKLKTLVPRQICQNLVKIFC